MWCLDFYDGGFASSSTEGTGLSAINDLVSGIGSSGPTLDVVAAAEGGWALRAGLVLDVVLRDWCADAVGVVAALGPAELYSYSAPVGDWVDEPVVCRLVLVFGHVLVGTKGMSVVICVVGDDVSVVNVCCSVEEHVW